MEATQSSQQNRLKHMAIKFKRLRKVECQERVAVVLTKLFCKNSKYKAYTADNAKLCNRGQIITLCRKNIKKIFLVLDLQLFKVSTNT